MPSRLKRYQTEGHDHFITDTNHGRREWWDVRVVGVTDQAEYNRIVAHRSAAYLRHEAKAGRTTPVLRSNLFLFFSVR